MIWLLKLTWASEIAIKEPSKATQFTRGIPMRTRTFSRQCTSNPLSRFCQNYSSFFPTIRSLTFSVFVIAIVGLVFSSCATAQNKNDDWLKEGLPDKLLPKPKKKAEVDADGLPRAARFQLEQKIIPALKSGDEGAFLKSMNLLVSKQPQSVVDAVEKYGVKNKIGSFKEIFSQSLIRAAASGMPIETKNLKPTLVEFTTSGVAKMVESELTELEKHILMQNPLSLPLSWEERERVFWDVHVWKNRFLNINRLVAFSKQIQQPLLDRAVKLDSEYDIEKYQAPLLLEKRVSSIYRDLSEREAELRFKMLAKSEETLRESKAADKRLNAAFALQLSGAELDLLFRKRKPGSFEREKLNDPNILKECEQYLASGKKHGQDAIQKSLLLRIGAHWWLRGRYGSSSEAYGLLKPMQAMNTPALMEGLYMPKHRPEAIGFIYNESDSESTGYDRRHYFTWAIERRDVVREVESKSYSDSSVETVGDAESVSFW